MTGQAARRAAVSVERFARNLDNAAAPDNRGALRQGNEDRRRRARTARGDGAGEGDSGRNPRGGIPARVSTNAGGFVCNHLYFGALQHLSGLGRATPAVFLHLPATPEQTPPRASTTRLSAAAAADALRAAAAAMVER